MARGRPKGSKNSGKPSGKKELIDIVNVDNCQIKADARQFVLINNGRQTYHGSILSLIDTLFERKLKSRTVSDLKDLKNAVIDAKNEINRNFSLSQMERAFATSKNENGNQSV